MQFCALGSCPYQYMIKSITYVTQPPCAMHLHVHAHVFEMHPSISTSAPRRCSRCSAGLCGAHLHPPNASTAQLHAHTWARIDLWNLGRWVYKLLLSTARSPAYDLGALVQATGASSTCCRPAAAAASCGSLGDPWVSARWLGPRGHALLGCRTLPTAEPGHACKWLTQLACDAKLCLVCCCKHAALIFLLDAKPNANRKTGASAEEKLESCCPASGSRCLKGKT